MAVLQRIRNAGTKRMEHGGTWCEHKIVMRCHLYLSNVVGEVGRVAGRRCKAEEGQEKQRAR